MKNKAHVGSRITRISGRTSIVLLNAATLGLYFIGVIIWQEQIQVLQLVTFMSYLSLALHCGRDLTERSPDPPLGVSRGSLIGAPLFAYSTYLLGDPEIALVAALVATLSFCMWLGVMAVSE